MKKILDKLPWIVLIILAFVIGSRLAKVKEVPYPVVIVKKEKADIPAPVIKWKDRIIFKWKEAHPETVYLYESNELPFEPEEAIITLEYKPNKLKFITKWIKTDTIGMETMMKGYIYGNIYPEFIITQSADGWFVKSRKDWFRKELYVGVNYPDIVFVRLDLLFNKFLISPRATTKRVGVDVGWKI